MNPIIKLPFFLIQCFSILGSKRFERVLGDKEKRISSLFLFVWWWTVRNTFSNQGSHCCTTTSQKMLWKHCQGEYMRSFHRSWFRDGTFIMSDLKSKVMISSRNLDMLRSRVIWSRKFLHLTLTFLATIYKAKPSSLTRFQLIIFLLLLISVCLPFDKATI